MALLAVTAVGAAVAYQSAAREREYRQLLAQGDAALAAGADLGGHRGLQRRHRSSARLDARPPEAWRNLPAARRPRERRRDFRTAVGARPDGHPSARTTGATPSTSSSATRRRSTPTRPSAPRRPFGAIRYRIGLRTIATTTSTPPRGPATQRCALDHQIGRRPLPRWRLCLREKGNPTEAMAELAEGRSTVARV